MMVIRVGKFPSSHNINTQIYQENLNIFACCENILSVKDRMIGLSVNMKLCWHCDKSRPWRTVGRNLKKKLALLVHCLHIGSWNWWGEGGYDLLVLMYKWPKALDKSFAYEENCWEYCGCGMCHSKYCKLCDGAVIILHMVKLPSVLWET